MNTARTTMAPTPPPIISMVDDCGGGDGGGGSKKREAPDELDEYCVDVGGGRGL